MPPQETPDVRSAEDQRPGRRSPGGGDASRPRRRRAAGTKEEWGDRSLGGRKGSCIQRMPRAMPAMESDTSPYRRTGRGGGAGGGGSGRRARCRPGRDRLAHGLAGALGRDHLAHDLAQALAQPLDRAGRPGGNWPTALPVCLWTPWDRTGRNSRPCRVVSRMGQSKPPLSVMGSEQTAAVQRAGEGT